MKSLARLLLVVLVVAVGGTTIALWWGVPVTLGPDWIQDQVEEAFPIERSQGGMLQVTLTDPDVLRDGSERLRIRVNVAARSTVFDTDYRGTSVVSGRLRYDPDAGALHVVDARIDDLSVTGLKPGEKAALMQMLSRQLADRLERDPILTLDADGDLQERLARRFVRSLEVRDASVRITLGFG